MSDELIERRGLSGSASRVKVSVVTITYNQEPYIAQAVESVLAQECDFDIEYVIGDDASSDDTPTILTDFQHRYPDRIRLVLRDANIGAQRNLADVLAMCTGQYVALLDGDDFWTSPHKLQKQVEFMEANPGCALSFHGVRVIRPGGATCDNESTAVTPERLGIEDLLRGNFISSCSVMYRWGLVDALPTWWNDTWIGDYPLHVLHAQHGWIGYIDEVLAAYRFHGDGLWSGEGAGARADEFLSTLVRLDEALNFKYRDVIKESIYKHKAYEFGVRFETAFRMEGRGERGDVARRVMWLLRNLRNRGDVSAHEVVVLVIKGTCPWLIRPLVAAKRVLRHVIGREAADKTSRRTP